VLVVLAHRLLLEQMVPTLYSLPSHLLVVVAVAQTVLETQLLLLLLVVLVVVEDGVVQAVVQEHLVKATLVVADMPTAHLHLQQVAVAALVLLVRTVNQLLAVMVVQVLHH
jgi:hypothetical protein